MKQDLLTTSSITLF